MDIPANTTVLIVGGGPAGSTAAALLAREGIDVVLVERSKFPRYHVGESLLPSCIEILNLTGARDLVDAYGFQRKPGAIFEWKGEQWTLDFGELSGAFRYSFQVLREEFDQLLLENARTQGARVIEGASVSELKFDGDRVVAARCGRDGEAPIWVACRYVIDASGRAGLITNKYLHTRRFHRVFQNIAIWGYWNGVEHWDRPQEGAITVASIPNGWLWAIPLRNRTMSIGAVLQKDSAHQVLRDSTLEQVYARAIQSSPRFSAMTRSATLISGVRAEQDYSYTSDSFAGPGYFLAGDAACFLDPLLSTGVHLAMYSALLSAASIASILRNEVSEAEALDYFDSTYRSAYLRLLTFVACFYDAEGKDTYYTKAEELSHFQSGPDTLKRAFLNLVSGLEDIADAEQITSHVLGAMTKRIAENFDLRKDKTALAERVRQESARENVRFFDAIEGLPALSADKAMDGLYVQTKPLGLARCTPNSTFP